MIAPARTLLLLGTLSAVNMCPSEPDCPYPDTPTPWDVTPTPWDVTPTPWDVTPTPEPPQGLNFDPATDASVICDERGWHITLTVDGWTEINPYPLFGMYDIPTGETDALYQELHSIEYMDSFVDPYYEVLYLDLAFADPDQSQEDGISSDFDCRREEVLSFQFCSYDYNYPADGLSCWAWGLAPGSVPAPQGY